MSNPASDRNPVVLVHGIWDTQRVFRKMGQVLTAQGWQVYGLDLVPSNGDLPPDALAKQLQEFINRTFAAEQSIDLVGFSMGGIVSRYYLQRLGGIDRVQRFISISSPHHGTLVGYFSQRPGAVQLRPNSPLLTDLNRDVDQLGDIHFTSLWTPMDAMIVPAKSSQLPVGNAKTIWVPIHAWMLTDDRVIQTVAQTLLEPC